MRKEEKIKFYKVLIRPNLVINFLGRYLIKQKPWKAEVQSLKDFILFH